LPVNISIVSDARKRKEHGHLRIVIDAKDQGSPATLVCMGWQAPKPGTTSGSSDLRATNRHWLDIVSVILGVIG